MTAKTEMRRELDSPRFYELIRMGEEACAAGAPKNPPDELNWQDRHTWMAGWHDQDVAMGNREVLYRK